MQCKCGKDMVDKTVLDMVNGRHAAYKVKSCGTHTIVDLSSLVYV